jgi:alpha-ketoglutarate-dependent taurine dioxygenase
MSTIQSALALRPVTAHTGAVVENLRLTPDLPQATVAELEQALLRYKVLFVRGQGQLDQPGQEGLARLLGTPQAHPTVPSADGRYSLSIDSAHGQRADRWHSDVTFIPNYPKISILRAIEVPDAGGDTLWANSVAAYESLPEPLKRLAEGLRAVHTNAYDYAVPRHDPNAKALEERRQEFTATDWRTEHPVVRVHPQTGERALVLGSFVTEISGFSRSDSKAVYELLQAHVERHEHIVRWRWAPGDVALWDNRATQHRAVNDFADGTRTLFRVTLEGEVPVGVDGRASELLARIGSDIPTA